MLPPANSPATGVARIHINPNGGLCYYVDVRNITGVLGAHIGFKNGTELGVSNQSLCSHLIHNRLIRQDQLMVY